MAVDEDGDVGSDGFADCLDAFESGFGAVWEAGRVNGARHSSKGAHLMVVKPLLTASVAISAKSSGPRSTGPWSSGSRERFMLP